MFFIASLRGKYSCLDCNCGGFRDVIIFVINCLILIDGRDVSRYPLSLMLNFFACSRPKGSSPLFLLFSLVDYWLDDSEVKWMGTILDHFLLGLMRSKNSIKRSHECDID